MKISCIQMDMRLGEVNYNFAHAEELIRAAVAAEHPDVAVLPETWNTGFFPKDLAPCADRDGERTEGGLLDPGAGAERQHRLRQRGEQTDGGVLQYRLRLRPGRGGHRGVRQDPSVYALRGARVLPVRMAYLPVYAGRQVLRIDHLLRYPVPGADPLHDPGRVDLLFVVAQWPAKRTMHLETLAGPRPIENQMFLALCNSAASDTACGGHSAIIDPWGEYLAQAGDSEATITSELDFSVIEGIRSSINVFRDRRPELYKVST